MDKKTSRRYKNMFRESLQHEIWLIPSCLNSCFSEIDWLKKLLFDRNKNVSNARVCVQRVIRVTWKMFFRYPNSFLLTWYTKTLSKNPANHPTVNKACAMFADFDTYPDVEIVDNRSSAESFRFTCMTVIKKGQALPTEMIMQFEFILSI